MPLVEVLTTSKSHTAPGWAYVPDTSFRNSSQSNTKASGGRKRGIREPAGRSTNLTSRQNQAIIRHLAELDRENHRENVHIPVPARQQQQQQRHVDHGRPTKSKMTSNVRRILQSQKTFKNHLDDEEAALAHQASMGVMGRQAGVGSSGGASIATAPAAAAAVAGTPVAKVAKASSSGRRSSTPGTAAAAKLAEAPVEPPPMSDRQKRARTRKSLATITAAEKSTETEKQKEQEAAAAAEEEAAPKTTKEEQQDTADGDADAMQIDTPVIKGLIKTAYDNDPLLKSHLPRPPTDRLMAALLAEPPLTYNSARARPSAAGKPARYFCTICGYWGKIKCRNCGVRTCGLDCYKVHEDSRCGAFF